MAKTAGLAGIGRQSRGGDEEDEELAAVQVQESWASAAKGEANASACDHVSLLGEPEPCAGRSRTSMPAELGRVPVAGPCRPRTGSTASPRAQPAGEPGRALAAVNV